MFTGNMLTNPTEVLSKQMVMNLEATKWSGYAALIYSSFTLKLLLTLSNPKKQKLKLRFFVLVSKTSSSILHSECNAMSNT